MDFNLTADERDIQKMAREFADKELAPLAAKIDREGHIPRALLQNMGELGFMGVIIPEAFGGAGLNNFMLALIQMEINRACASTGVTMSVHNSLVTSPIIKFGTEAQKKKYLPRMATAEILGAYSLTEPEAGSDAASLRTTAVKRDGQYVLNGSKVFVTNGGDADLFIIFARTNPGPAVRAKGISAFFVERNTKGLIVGKPEHKLGIRGSTTVQIFLEDCAVPAENLLGVENEGFKIAMNTLDGGRIGIAGQAIGIARACLDASLKYSKERKQFGHFLHEFQAIQWKLAEMSMEIEAATLLILKAARLRDEGKPHTSEAAQAKLFASRLANRAATEAVQIHGGVGYTKDFPVERYFRDAKITEIYEGTSEIQHIVIARNLIGS